jgi:hypothetical protein
VSSTLNHQHSEASHPLSLSHSLPQSEALNENLLSFSSKKQQCAIIAREEKMINEGSRKEVLCTIV